MTKVEPTNVLAAFEDISLPGIKSLTDRRQPLWAKIIWSLVFLICTGLCIYQVAERIDHFFEYPVNLMYELKHLEVQKIPKITLCTNENTRIKKILLVKGNRVGSASSSISNAVVWNITGHSVPDFVDGCKYFGDKSCMSRKFWREHMTASGRCHTLDVGAKGINVDVGGFSTGFKITLKTPSGTRLAKNLAWKVLVHDDNTDSLYEPLINGIPLVEATLTTVIFTYKQDVPSRHCIDKRSVIECLLKCSDQYFLQKYQCRLPFMTTVTTLPPCSPDIEMAEAEYLAYHYDLSTCQCPTACVDESYDIQVDSRRDDSTVLKVYQGREEMELFEERRAYVFYALICEIGGIMGLYLGACLLTFVEIFDVVLLAYLPGCALPKTLKFLLKSIVQLIVLRSGSPKSVAELLGLLSVMASIVLKTLSVLLGLFFIFVGIMKITPKLNRDMHRDIRKSFVQYAKVFPMAQWFGFKVSSKWFRRSVGIVEALCGLALLFLPGCFKQFANFVLLLLMIGAVFIHHTIGDRFERTAPAIVFTFMLTCRMVVYLQVRRKSSREAKAAAASDITSSTSTTASTTNTPGTSASTSGEDVLPKKVVKQD